jgi:low affinity Fe/Cu permease
MKQIGIAVAIAVITLSIFLSGYFLGRNTSTGYVDLQRVEQKLDTMFHYLGMDNLK